MRRAAYWLTVALVFTLPWENVTDIQGLGTISRIVGLGAAAVWALALLGTRTVRPPTAAHGVAFLFVVWNGLSAIWSVDPAVSIGRFFTFAQLLVLIYILWDTTTTYRDLRTILQAYVFGAWVTVISLLYQYFVYGPAQYQVRFTIGNFQFDDIGLVLTLAVPIAWYLGTTPQPGRAKYLLSIVNLVAVPGVVVGVLFSGSRAALIAIIPSAIYIIVSLARLTWRWRIVALAAVGGLLWVFLPLVPTDTLDRIGSTSTDRSQGDLNGRSELWSAAYQTFEQHPITGVGTGAFREEWSGKVAHNVWLRLAAELGLVGLGLFLALVGIALASVWRAPRLSRGMLLALVTSWAVGATFYNFEDKKQTWLLLALPVISAALATTSCRSRSKHQQTRSPEFAPATRRVRL
jgi:O-antigen ligase